MPVPNFSVMKKIIFFLFSVWSHIPAWSQLCFIPKVNYSCGITPQNVHSNDFDGDGKKDLVVADASGSVLQLYLGNGNGTFASPATFNAGSAPYSMTSADFNSDGKMDLVAANLNGFNISVLMGTGSGFLSAVNYPVGFGPTGVVTADFNSDPHPDLAVVSGSSVHIFTGSSAGTFVLSVSYTIGSSLQSITSADFNNDGKKDLAVVDLNGTAAVFIGTGSGTFSAPVTYPAGVSASYITSADFNNDSKMDLAVADFGSLNVLVYMGNGMGGFGSASIYQVGGGSNSISPADFDGDGFTDIVTANFQWFDVAALRNKGNGTFEARIGFNAGNQPVFSTAADFNGDGRPDLAVVSQQSASNLHIFLSGTTPTIVPSPADTSICLGSTVNLTVSGASTYTWSVFSTATVITVLPTSNTTYTVTGFLSPACFASTVVNVSVNIPPDIYTSTPTLVTLCSGELFSSNVYGANTYTWMPDNVESSQFSSIVYSNSVFTITGRDNNGCESSTSVTLVVKPCTGLDETLLSSGPTPVYPNPSSRNFNIENRNDSDIEVYDLTGVLIYSQKQFSGTCVLDLGEKPSGIYLLRIKTNKTHETLKLIKE